MDNKTVVESVRDFILTCPHLEQLAKVDINFLDNKSINYSIETTPSQNGGIVNEYLDGSKEMEFLFVFACMFDYSEDLQQQIENCGFFEMFEEWILECNDNDVLPMLSNGKKSTSIECTTSGYTFLVSPTMDKARCQIQLKLIYEKEK